MNKLSINEKVYDPLSQSLCIVHFMYISLMTFSTCKS